MSRDKGSGSIYQDSDGRWRASIEAGYTATGNRRRLKVSGRTKSEAQLKLKKKLRQIAESGIPEPGTTRTTVKAWSTDWLAVRVSKVRPKTYLRDESAINRWIIPTIGEKRLDALTPAHIRAVSKAITDAKRTSSSAHRVQATLVKMLKDAKRDGYAVPPLVLQVDAPTLAVSDRQGLSIQGALAMLTTSTGGERARWGAAFLEGMRQGECLGLTWSMLDFERDQIDVSWQLQNLPYQHGCDGGCGYKRAGSCPERAFQVPHGYEYQQLDGAWCLVRPKTASGQRVLPMVSWLADALRGWRAECPESPHDLVWPLDDGSLRLPDDDTAAWRDLQTRSEVQHPGGRPYHVHEARHTTGTLLMALGVPESVRIAIMGHAGIRSTQNYEHADIEMAREALEGMASRLGLSELESA